MGHIVVVEDDNDMGYLLSHLINKEDWLDAIHIPTVDAAMNPGVWDLYNVVGLVDLMLPEYTGIEVAQWVTENISRNIPLIGMTAASEHSPIYKDARDSGLFLQIFHKPIPYGELFSLLRRTLNGNS